MSKTIVLKDAASSDVTFNLVSSDNPQAIVYENQTGPLIGRKRIVMSMKTNANVNRIKARVSVPRTTIDSVSGKATVEWTNVASLDVSAVLFSDAASLSDVSAMLTSLSSQPAFTGMVINGENPAV